MHHLYTYRPLPPQCHTRILELHPSQDKNVPVRGTLEDIDIYRDYDYRALSYTWGPPMFTHKIVLGDNNSDAHLMITPSLHDALVRFRDPHQVVRLWVDALCINQNDADEKARQIPMMGQIYSTASMVWVWLGTEEKAASHLAALNSASRQLDRIGVEKMVHPHVREVIKQRWFSRRWIVQEVVLNDEVHLFSGSQTTMPWHRFIGVVLHLLKFCPSIPEFAAVRMMAILAEERRDRRRGEQTPKRGLLEVLDSFSSLGCFDDRDRIYALAGLSADVGVAPPGRQDPYSTALQVDYTKSVEDVYISLVSARMDRLRDSKRLLQYGAQRSNGTHLNSRCSWAPDWRLPVLRWNLGGGIALEGHRVKVDQQTGYLHIEFRSQPGLTSEPTGYVSYASVTRTSETFPPDASDSGIAAWMRKTWEAVKQTRLRATPLEINVLLTQLERLVTEDPDRPWLSSSNGVWYDGFHSLPEFRRMVLGDSRGAVYVPSSSPDLFRAIRKIMTGRSLLFGSVMCPGTTSSFSTSVSSLTSALSKASSLFSRNKIPAPALTQQNNNNAAAPSAWPVMAIGPSHTKPGDVLCSLAKVEVECLSNDPEGTSHSYYEHLGTASCILRPHTHPPALNSQNHHLSPGSQHQHPPPSPPRTPSPPGRAAGGGDGARFLYIGETRSYRLCEVKHTGKWDPKIQQKAIARHSQRLSSIVLC